MRRRGGSTWLALLALAVASASLALNLARPDAWPFGAEEPEADPGARGLRPIAELPPLPGLPAPAPEPPPPPVVEAVPEPGVEERARALLEGVAERLRRAEEAEARLEDVRAAAARAEVAVQTARLGLDLARLSLRDFQLGHFPQLRRGAEDEVTLQAREVEALRERISWAKVLMKRGYGDEKSIFLYEKQQEDARAALEAARERLRGLVEVTMPRQVAELEGRIARAEAALQTHAADLEQQQARALRLRDEVESEQPSAREREAILALEESLRLAGSGDESRARRALEEADSAWRIERDRRAAVMRSEDRRRLERAAGRLREGGPGDRPE